MKRTMLVVTMAFGMAGCDFGEPPSPGPLSAAFLMTDTLGLQKTTFRSGENFDFNFAIVNNTDGQITYHKGDSGPVAIVQILQNDSVVATSIDGYVFLMIVSTGHLPPGQSLQEHWRAPNTPARDPMIVLSPGSYEARVLFAGFDEVKVTRIPPIAFSITH